MKPVGKKNSYNSNVFEWNMGMQYSMTKRMQAVEIDFSNLVIKQEELTRVTNEDVKCR